MEENLGRLCQVVREEFPDDEIVSELYVLRAALTIESGHITLEQALKSSAVKVDSQPGDPKHEMGQRGRLWNRREQPATTFEKLIASSNPKNSYRKQYFPTALTR